MSLPDRRRVLGPTDTQIFAQPEILTEPVYKDGPRPVFISQGVAKHASGSSYLETGPTRLQCMVYGPVPLKGEVQRQAKINVKTKVEQYANITTGREDAEQAISDFVQTAVIPAIITSEYPDSAINIDIIVFSGPQASIDENDANRAEISTTLLASGLNAAMLALVNAGINMKDMVTAASACIHENTIYSDVDVGPDVTQIAAAFFSQGNIAGLQVVSPKAVTRQELESLLEKASSTAKTLHSVFKSYLIEDYASLE